MKLVILSGFATNVVPRLTAGRNLMALTLNCSVDAKVKLFKSTLTTMGRCVVKQRRVPAKDR